MTAPDDREQVLDRYTKHVNKSLASLARLVAAPVEVAAVGSKVRGSDGHTYLDCGGFGVFLLGHCRPTVVAAVGEQLARNPLATRLFLNPELAQAAADLADITPSGLDYVFLTNSGAEATELGLKLARLAGKRHVIAMHGGFHGKTLGALSVTGRAQYRDPFGPLLPMVDFVPFGDPTALLAVLTAESAVLLEPVQAEGGVPSPDISGSADLIGDDGRTADEGNVRAKENPAGITEYGASVRIDEREVPSLSGSHLFKNNAILLRFRKLVLSFPLRKAASLPS